MTEAKQNKPSPDAIALENMAHTQRLAQHVED